MRDRILRKAEQYAARRRSRRAWGILVGSLACVVVLLTVHTLVLPAATLEDPGCDLEEHTHSDACYTQAAESYQKLACPLEVHQHTNDCRDDSGALICGYADFVIHKHNDPCYDEAGELVCTLPEIWAHAHDESCYTQHVHGEGCYTRTKGELTCGLEESEGHTHIAYTSPEEPGCYDAEGNVVCGQEETSGHQHTDQCYSWTQELTCTQSTERVLTCGKEEVILHTHTDACYGTDGDGSKILTCGQQEILEHTHGDGCFQTVTPDPEPTCGKEEHTHTEDCQTPPESSPEYTCGLEEHTHSETCYAEDGTTLTCGLTEHTHTDVCNSSQEPEYTCGLEEHTHSEACYAEDGTTLTCELTEHTHTDQCKAGADQTEEDQEQGTALTQEEQAQVDQVAALIEALPTEEALWQTLASYEEADDWDGYDAYLSEAMIQARATYAAFSALSEAQQQALPNAEKLLALELLWSDGVAPLAEVQDEVVDSGTIEGTNVTWKITVNDAGEYTVYIDGEGEIPNYTDANYGQAPWGAYASSRYNLVIGDGITRIGNRAFQRANLRSLQIGTGVQSIGYAAFRWGSITERVVIPGNVRNIGECAFQQSTFTNGYTISEGVEVIGGSAFQNASSPDTEIHLPASVKSISNGSAFTNVTAFTVADGNENYIALDGILYTSDMKTLVSFPKRKVMTEYEIPATVETITAGALEYVSGVDRLVIPSSVKSASGWVFRDPGYKEIIIKDGCTIGKSGMGCWFYNCSSLERIVFPENTAISLAGVLFHTGTFSRLTELNIPSGTTAIGRFGNTDSGASFPALKTVRYNAANARINDEDILTTRAYFDLVIGEDVNNLPANFDYFVNHATSITFEKNNQFTVDSNAFAAAPSPLNQLSGNVYVDSQGVVYTYDAENHTATMVYCPAGVTSITIPATITPEENVTCTVNAIGQNTLRYAEDLTSINFANIQNITKLDAYALANCPTLTSVNGESTYQDALDLFTSAERGYSILHNTGLTDAPGTGAFEQTMDGGKELTIAETDTADMTIKVSSDKGTMEWQPTGGTGSAGGYRLLTGDTMTITASVGNREGNQDYVYRVYFQLTDEQGSLSMKPGDTNTFNGQRVTCYATEVPNTVYLEFIPDEGGTSGVPMTAVYPSPSSPGGGLTVWGVILTQDQAKAQKNKLVESKGGSIQAYWTTEPEPFTLEKTSRSNNTNIGVVGDGSGGAKPSANLIWDIKLTHGDTTDATMGKDFVKSVEYTDVVTFPMGVSWNEKVKAAIQSGNIRTSGNTVYALTDDGQVTVAALGTGVSIYWDETKDTAVLKWTKYNTSTTSELGADTVAVTIYADAVSVDMTTLGTDQKKPINNQVDAIVHYSYSADQDLSAQTDGKTISGGNGRIELKKAVSTSSAYFGEDITYTINLSNPGGLPWTGTEIGSYLLSDALNRYLYITPAHMQAMFEEPYGADLTITIQKATLAPWEKVTGTDGSEAWRHAGNSDMGDSSITYTLTVSKAEESGYQVAVRGGDTYTANTVEEALRSADYAVTTDAAYTCRWALNDAEDFLTVQSGESREFKIYATVKDTFMMLTMDWIGHYPTESNLNTDNAAQFRNPGDRFVLGSNQVRTSVKREALVWKTAWNETQGTDHTTASNGDVMRYDLVFTHYGSGAYEDLPMVDDLDGSQLLLVPVAQNSHLSNLGLDTKAADGGNYYILKVSEEPYTNVVVGMDDEGNALTAATITVTQTGGEETAPIGGGTRTYTGVHTQIKWYFAHLEGESYQKTVTYRTLVDTSLPDAHYTIGNMVWMNDKPGSRIYDALRGGTIIDFNKEIVTQRGNSPDEDVVDDDDYTAVHPGETVLYRIALENTGDYPYTLKGTDLTDALPQTHGTFSWTEDNVKYMGSAYEGGTEPVFNGVENWSIGDSYPGLDLEGRQYILWPEGTQVNFTDCSTLYLYFELTFPVDTAGGEDTWSQYTAANKGNMVDNTLYVYRFPVNVLHGLAEEGQVLLQKGVYSFERRDNVSWMNWTTQIGSTRLNYNNRDSKYHSVTYYVTLYNGESKRLYLNDLYDCLPKGFSYLRMATGGTQEWNGVWIASGQSAITTIGGTSLGSGYPLVNMQDLGGKPVVYRSAKIQATASGNTVRFTFGAGTGNYAVKYDEVRGQYYLDEGEAIVFGYVADIGLAADTDDQAVNAIAMPYTDHLGTGVETIDTSDMLVQAPDTQRYSDQNDGSRLTMTAAEVADKYGFEGDDGTWLVSDVTVTRGEIIPGVTKVTESYKNNGGTFDYTNSIAPQDTVNWSVLLQNSGTLAITDYTFTDIMPAPFAFEGTVSYIIRDAQGNTIRNGDLMLFPTRTGGEESLTITRRYGNGNVNNAKFDGTWYDLAANQASFALNRDDDGNEILYIHFEYQGFSIPEGGSMELKFSSRNPTDEFHNQVYYNQALLTPNNQTFKDTGQGAKVKDENGKDSVRNYSIVTVNFGYKTSSEKSVVEVDNEANAAVSSDQNSNTILIHSTNSTFRYTLTVENDPQYQMESLVLIDNLPEVRDHSPFNDDLQRGSAFQVNLAENPDFRVTITSGGETRTLDANRYSIAFSKTTAFGGPGSSDWQGESSETIAEWVDSLHYSDVRAIRMILKNDADNPIPRDAKIQFSFNAQVVGDPAPGSTAWNNFGYHYTMQVGGSEVSLEAMPMVVGVQIPRVPTLVKELVDSNGQPVKAEEEKTFSFLIYAGEPLTGTFTSAETLKDALKDKDRAYKQVSLTVEKDQNASEIIELLPDENWQYTAGQKYTVVELPSDDQDYQLRGFNNTVSSVRTFTYDPARSESISCQNERVKWSIKLTKKDGDDQEKPLPGAVFGLYSPNAGDRIEIPEKYEDLSIQANVIYSGQNWYLSGIETTDASGQITWENLLRAQYYVLELKAPDGYKLNAAPGQILSRDDATQFVYEQTVYNSHGFILPLTGGSGTLLYTAGGLALMAAALGVYIGLRRKKGKTR